MNCTKCTQPINPGEEYHRTKKGAHHRECPKAQAASPAPKDHTKVYPARTAVFVFTDDGKCFPVVLSGQESTYVFNLIQGLHGGTVKLADHEMPMEYRGE